MGLAPGEDFVARMRTALERADRLLAVCSEAYFASVFAGAELGAAFAQLGRSPAAPSAVGNCLVLKSPSSPTPAEEGPRDGPSSLWLAVLRASLTAHRLIRALDGRRRPVRELTGGQSAGQLRAQPGCRVDSDRGHRMDPGQDRPAAPDR